MRNSLIYHASASLDGYIARPDGSLAWLEGQRATEFQDGFDSFYAGIDALLMGRGTYQALLARNAPWAFPGKPCVVLSRLALRRASSEVQLTHSTPSQAVDALRDAGFARIWLVGGSLLAGSCYTAGLIDEVIVNLIPVLLGAGIPLLATDQERNLSLYKLRQLGCDAVQLHYLLQTAETLHADAS